MSFPGATEAVWPSNRKLATQAMWPFAAKWPRRRFGPSPTQAIWPIIRKVATQAMLTFSAAVCARRRVCQIGRVYIMTYIRQVRPSSRLAVSGLGIVSNLYS